MTHRHALKNDMRVSKVTELTTPGSRTKRKMLHDDNDTEAKDSALVMKKGGTSKFRAAIVFPFSENRKSGASRNGRDLRVIFICPVTLTSVQYYTLTPTLTPFHKGAQRKERKSLIIGRNRTWVLITMKSKSRTWLGMMKSASFTIRVRAGTASKYRAGNSRTTRTLRRVPVAVSSFASSMTPCAAFISCFTKMLIGGCLVVAGL